MPECGTIKKHKVFQDGTTSRVPLGQAAAGLIGRAKLILEHVATASPDQLQSILTAMYADWAQGLLTDDEASVVEAKISQRQRSKFEPRRHRASPDRIASRHRRRRLGGSSALPDTLRQHFTEGERAVLCIIAGEVKVHGYCDLYVDHLAALAGVSRTTAQNALRAAKALKIVDVTERPLVGRKNLSNVIRIVSAEWKAWIKRGPCAHRATGFKFENCLRPTKSQNKKERGFRDGRAMLGSFDASSNRRVPVETGASEWREGASAA